MVTLYRTPDSTAGQRAQDALEAMVIAHEVVTVPADADRPEALTAHALTPGDLPALIDEGTAYTGAALDEHLKRLRRLMSDWNRFQSDACYIEADGTICGEGDLHNDRGPGMTSAQVGS